MQFHGLIAWPESSAPLLSATREGLHRKLGVAGSQWRMFKCHGRWASESTKDGM